MLPTVEHVCASTVVGIQIKIEIKKNSRVKKIRLLSNKYFFIIIIFIMLEKIN